MSNESIKMASAIYEKMCGYAGPDHESECINSVLVPWIESDGKRIADLEQQLEAAKDERAVVDKALHERRVELEEMRREYDSLMDENISVAERNLAVTQQLSTLRVAAQDAVDEGRTSTRIDKMLALEELLKDQDK